MNKPALDTSILVNSELVKIGRAADMLWMSFGKPVEFTDKRGRSRTVTEYAIHVQCTWRFTRNGTILLGLNDIYHPFDGKNEGDPDWDWDIFDRDDSEKSVFNIKAYEINNTLLPLAVKSITVRDNGDLNMELEKDMNFELFVYSSTRREFWRFIHFRENGESIHTVVFED